MDRGTLSVDCVTHHRVPRQPFGVGGGDSSTSSLQEGGERGFGGFEMVRLVSVFVEASSGSI